MPFPRHRLHLTAYVLYTNHKFTNINVVAGAQFRIEHVKSSLGRSAAETADVDK
jgi:hypothetical protein